MSLFMLFYMTFDFIAYTKFKEGQLGGENGLFFFTTGVFKCKIYVTSEFKKQETMDVLDDSSRNGYLPTSHVVSPRV